MKRFFAVLFATLFLVPVLACGAAAAESYIFYPREATPLDDMLTEFAGTGQVFMHWGLLPDGRYSFSIGDDYEVLSSVNDIDVVFVPDPEFDSIWKGVVQVLVDGNVCSLNFAIVRYENVTVAGFFFDEDLAFESTEGLTLRFVPVDSSGSINIFDYVSESTLAGIFDEVVALLPVVLGCMVVFLGIRKGITFIRGILLDA